jgi:hypothetical protein
MQCHSHAVGHGIKILRKTYYVPHFLFVVKDVCSQTLLAENNINSHSLFDYISLR